MKIVVKQKENAEEIPTEIIAQSIKDISDGVKKLRSGKLNDKAIILLISKASSVSLETVRSVLTGMENLEKQFLKK